MLQHQLQMLQHQLQMLQLQLQLQMLQFQLQMPLRSTTWTFTFLQCTRCGSVT